MEIFGEMRQLTPFWKRFFGFHMVMYAAMILCTIPFLFEVKEWDVSTVLVIATAIPVYSLAYMAAGMLLSALVAAILRKRKCRDVAAATVAGIFSALSQMLVLADFGLFRGFGFHFNMFVWNLITTPGGFASMGLRNDTTLPLVVAILLISGLNVFAVWGIFFSRGGKVGEALYRPLSGWKKFAFAAVLVIFGVANSFLFAWHHYMKNSVPLLAAERIPWYQRSTMKNFFRRTLKIKEPKRTELLMRIGKSKSIRYPKAPIRRRADRKRFNVVWLACESWRADMLNDEVMPNTCRFAEKYAVSFKDNHSGGNGTRQGVFTMFYGLYGNYWHSFLSGRTGAQIIDWMIEDNYDFGCFTSAKFSYPEFDQTIFAKLPASVLHSFDRAVTYKRDIRNTKLLTDFIAADRGDKPFMAFMFFESPHYPYEFPPENAKFKDYAANVNYLQLGAEHAERIKNRYRNSCFTLDGFLGRVFALLEEKKLLDNTIVVVVGDHGEEFFEHGRLGHNSVFTREQIRTPLLLHIPGVKPGVYTGMSSHVDIVAMLAPHFGVENDPGDFCLGKNLIGPKAPVRNYAIIAGWDTFFFVGKKYKMVLPLNSFDAVTMKLYDAQDNPLPDSQVFFREYREELVEVQKDMRRFY